MHTHSGILKYNKADERAIRTVLNHVREDMSFAGGGTFAHKSMVSDKHGNYKVDEGEWSRAERGVALIEWILDFYKNSKAYEPKPNTKI